MAIGEIFLAAFLQVLIEKLSSPALGLFLKLVGRGKTRKTIEQWESQLRLIETVLAVAEQQQLVNSTIKPWLQKLQDLAYDMEDILDDFAIQAHAHHLKNTTARGFLDSAKKKVKSLSVIVNPISQVKSQPKIDNITDRLHNIQTQISGLNLTVSHIIQQQTLQIEAFRQKRETTSLVPMVVGRDDEKNAMITLLLKDDQSNENYVVIPIVGKGGIGKTTLAQYVYNDRQQLKGRFDLKAWVCVSDVFDVKRITTTIIKAVAGGTVSDLSNLNEAQEKLKQELMCKKFLIVLDDIWNENYDDWDLLRKPFQHAAKGSRIIMTTRNEKIAAMMLTNSSINNSIINIGSLSGDDCWRVFQQHANGDSDLVEMQDKIVEKCKGLPLAVKALAGLLKKTVERRQRREILESNLWSEDFEQSSVLPVLRLSYHHLPSHLKLIFAYCAVFPKDYIFQEMEVVLLWMAQGFLPENQTKRVEDIGHNYFCELVSRSLFEASHEEGFIMHDLIHDLALWAADDLCYVIDTINISERDFRRTRHVSIHAATLRNQIPMASKLRSFYCIEDVGGIEISDFIQRFRYIRTLRLFSHNIKVLPKCIGNLKHLRFLHVNIRNLKELPKSMDDLWNLQTLWLEDQYVFKKLPNIRSLQNLRHLKIGRYSSLKEMPKGIGQLTNLQSLDHFVLGNGRGERIRDLKNLNHLHGKLRISRLESVLKVEDAKEAELDKKDGLGKLCLEWENCSDDNIDRDVLEQLRPHNSIKQLKLFGYGGLTFPTWLGNPCFRKMVGINLEYCERCEYLPPLGQLPLLRNLSLECMHGIKEIGADFYGVLGCQNPSFPVLENLSLWSMRSLEKWVHSPAHDHAFSSLKELSIEFCSSLKELSPHLPCLKKLKITKCEEELSVSLQNLPLLEVFKVEDCSSIELKIDEKVVKTDGVGCSSVVGAECVKGLFELAHLTELTMKRCSTRISLPAGMLLPAVEHLAFEDCKDLGSLPSQLHNYTSLKKLTIHCETMEEFPEGGLPINLEQLKIEVINIKQRVQELAVHHLHSLQSIRLIAVGMTPKDLSLPSSLSDLYLCGSKNLETISSCTTLLNLTKLWVSHCPKFESLVGNFTSLLDLKIRKCPNFQFCAQDCLPKNLTDLTLDGISHTNKPIGEWGLHLLSSLQSLTLEDLGSSITGAVECIPSPNLQLPSSLGLLYVTGFQNLKSINCSSFPNQTDLWILECPKFESFGEHGLPPKLQIVEIYKCESLKPHLKIDPDGPVHDMGGCRYTLL